MNEDWYVTEIKGRKVAGPWEESWQNWELEAGLDASHSLVWKGTLS